MTLRLGEVVLIRMQFHQAPAPKSARRWFFSTVEMTMFVAAPITSQLRLSEYDPAIEDWRAAGLNVASWGRIHKLTVLAKAEVVRSLGSLSDADRESLAAVLCRAFCPRPRGT